MRLCERGMMRSLYKNQRDIGVLYNVVSGEQTSHSTEDNKDGNSSSDTSAEAAASTSFKNKFPQSLESLTDRQTKARIFHVKAHRRRWRHWTPSWTKFYLYYF